MLKKMFVVLTLVAGVSVFADVDLKTLDVKNLTADKVAEIKTQLTKSTGLHAAVASMAVTKFESNKDLTFVEMETIAKKYCNKKGFQVLAVVLYIDKTQSYNKYASDVFGDEKYTNSEYFCKLVVDGKFNYNNVQDCCFVILSKSKRVNYVSLASNKMIESCNQTNEKKAVENLKKAYQILLPRLVDFPEFKTPATKLGLALKAYGVDVK